ncbi:CotH kinase family protein [Neolewinella lacunae]|uniref:CotH kinase family protein n=1 Tax=Neolewinella lacunae TaxID=1517758 RepID=A0A923PN28_9BACT|nr:CotH kinase family protein [Neolewinella lacunae]MBC6995736.1 CotH kinase family protein [Neolewinella lacunae]MDN3636571.1 CotH kinase family protein [Neolewinella lacunae]
MLPVLSFLRRNFRYGALLFWGAVAGAVLGQGSGASLAAGFYPGPQTLTLPAGVRYTLDGSTPTANSLSYTEALRLERTTVLRFQAFDSAGRPQGPPHGGTYLIGEPPTRLLTVAVIIDPWRLFDPVHGWFVAGPGADPGDWKQPGANWWTRKQHPAHVDLIETDGRNVFSATTDWRMFGGMSRLHAQKSFSLSARKAYGAKRFRHPLFGPEGPEDCQFLVVRNGGSDWQRAYLRDALLTGLLRDPSWDLDHQAARPVQVYLNGKYWGIYHLREKINPQFIADRHDIADKDDIDLLEHEETVKHGQLGSYQRLIDFVAANDLSQPGPYRRVQELMDVDNYQRLQIAQTYFDNRDAGGNIRYWRNRSDPASRWRWILYDVDQGFGLHDGEAYRRNTLAFFTEANGPAWPNPPWSTLLQRKLLTNPHYRCGFVNRSLDYLHTDFAPATVLAAIEKRVAELEQDMPRQLARWKGSEQHWRIHLDRLRTFARERPTYLREHLRTHFAAGEDREVYVAAGPGGRVVLNHNVAAGEEGIRGRYFAHFPIHLRAVAEKGYVFQGWEGLEATDPTVELDLADARPRRIRANFEPLRHALAERIVFTEICPASAAAGDWLEIHNRSAQTVNLRDWQITDGTHELRLPALDLRAGGYLVLSEDPVRFAAAYPGLPTPLALPFGLRKSGETLGIYGPLGAFVNSIDFAPEPTPGDFVYALTDPGLDNTDPRYWATAAGPGTPGQPNPRELESAVLTSSDFYWRIGFGLLVLLAVVALRVVTSRP